MDQQAAIGPGRRVGESVLDESRLWQPRRGTSGRVRCRRCALCDLAANLEAAAMSNHVDFKEAA